MKLYFCKRGAEYWKGSLLLAARGQKEAKKIFQKNEEGEDPHHITDMDRTCSGRAAIIYDDSER